MRVPRTFRNREPVYSVPVPDQPGDAAWVDMSVTWRQPLTVEETGAHSGETTVRMSGGVLSMTSHQ